MREILAAAIIGAMYAMLFLLFLVVSELRTQTQTCMQPTIQAGE